MYVRFQNFNLLFPIWHHFHLPPSLHTLTAKIKGSFKSFWEHHQECNSCKASSWTRHLFRSLPCLILLAHKAAKHSLCLKHCAGHFSTNNIVFSIQQPHLPYCSHCSFYHWYIRAPHSALPKIRSSYYSVWSKYSKLYAPSTIFFPHSSIIHNFL